MKQRAPAWIRAATGLSLAAMSAACMSPLPALTWVRLPEQMVVAPPGPVASAALARETWQLLIPVALPGYLDREAVLVAQGPSVLRTLGELRWAEPLRDMVPRLLRVDLERQFGAPVWGAPLPAGLAATRQLRVQLDAFDLGDEARELHLRARWWLADARGAPLRQGHVQFSVPAAATAEGVATAHRQALSQLAQQLAQQLSQQPSQ